MAMVTVTGTDANVASGFDEHDWEGAQELTDDEKRELARDIDEAIRQVRLVAGKVGEAPSVIGSVICLRLKINWREVLREFIQTTWGSDYPRGHVLTGVTYRLGTTCLAVSVIRWVSLS